MATDSEERALERIKQHCKQVAIHEFNMTEDIVCDLKPLGAGLNFLSDAYFATVTSPTTSIRMFAKVPPEMDVMKKEFFNLCNDSGMRIFEREFFVYTKLQEEFVNMITSAGGNPKDFMNGFVRPFVLPGEMTIYRSLTEPLVLEDLSEKGYTMWEDEFGGMDMPHTLAVMEALGNHHALSMTLLAGPGIKNETTSELINLDYREVMNDQVIAMVNNSMDTCLDWMKSTNQSQDNIKKATEIRANNNWIDMILEKFDPRNDFPYNVITHGDSRANNFMFSYSSDKKTPVDVKILDFQLSIRLGFFYDLLYFIFTSVSSSVMIPNHDYIIKKYHSSLTGRLARLKYNRKLPSVEELSTLLEENAIFGYYMGLMITFITCQSEDQKDVKYRSLMEIAKHFKIFT